jgi:adenylate cyclase
MRSLPEYLRFRVRYGINTGLAIVGNFGSDRRIDYTVLGQPVNLAARISKAAEPNSILIGPETFEAIEPQALFKVRRIEGKRFKGLKGPIKLYEVEGFL